jgi:hypothetical protein
VNAADSLTSFSGYISRLLAAEREQGIRDGVTASGNGRLIEVIDQLNAHNRSLLACEKVIRSLITCAENGYDTQTLHDIVDDARKAVSK